jgi:hypothetical protein
MARHRRLNRPQNSPLLDEFSGRLKITLMKRDYCRQMLSHINNQALA